MAVRRTAGLAAAVLLALGAAVAASASPAGAVGSEPAAARIDEQTVAEPSGYRMDDYRSPTPAGLSGATTIDTQAAKRLFEERSAAFIDVLPRAPRPKGLPADTVWRPKPRDDIPGSFWLVDTGYGELAEVMEAYFLAGLAKASGGDKAKPLVFYCLSECWMSWNAAKRAMAAGYTKVFWYPEGTDGWAAAGLPLERREPERRPDE